ncbi:hypothetical protein HPB47_006877 [Ixodes persulcatus]|uniref:Uncharacterized protein n=1 Tax=Ixodes persulcatus TaxID=34615 RepID=A0AC60P941_IXOPE|nr:hypothetical protein HPB47_006877 [Ixodes persulcatus]
METMDSAAVTANPNAVFRSTMPTLNPPKPETTTNWPALPTINLGPPPSHPHPVPVPQSTANEIKSLPVALLGKASKEEIAEMFLQALDDPSQPEASENKHTTTKPRLKSTPIPKPNEKASATSSASTPEGNIRQDDIESRKRHAAMAPGTSLSTQAVTANTLVSTAATQSSITEDDGPPSTLVQSKKTIKRARYTRKKTTESDCEAQASRQRFTILPPYREEPWRKPSQKHWAHNHRRYRDRLRCDTLDIVTARLLGRKGRTATITFEGNRLPRFVKYALCKTPVYPYRAKALTCTNCHGAGHKQDICHKETKREIGKLLRERARKHAKPNQESRRKKAAPPPPPPSPPFNPIQPPPILERTYAELVGGRKPNQDVSKRQAMVYLRSDWPQYQIDLRRWCTDRQEVAVRATHPGTPVIFASVYYRPGASRKSPRENGLETVNGPKLLEDMTRFKYTLLNTPGSTTRLGLTRRHRHTSPDLTWIYGKTGNLSWHVNIDTWGSDHLPIKIEVDSKTSEKKRRSAHTVNWELYRRHLENSQAESFATAMLDALKAATTRSNIPADAPTPDIHLLNLWARKPCALQRYRRGPKTLVALREVTRHSIAAQKGARGKNIRSIVSIDVREACDSIPHWAVIQEAERLGIQGRALNFIKVFLKDQTFSVNIGDHTSDPRPNRVGVPQGSVLSPLLFNMAIADIPHLLSRIPSFKFTIYADDISPWTVTGGTRTQQQTLQAGLHEVQTHLNGTRVGMYIDKDGSCRTWMTKVSQQFKAIIHVIRRICSSRGGANEEIAPRAQIATLRKTQKPLSHLHDHDYASPSPEDDEDKDDYDPDKAKQQIKLPSRTALMEHLPPISDPLRRGFGRRTRKSSVGKGARPPTCCYCKDPQHVVDLVHLLWGCKGFEAT